MGLITGTIIKLKRLSFIRKICLAIIALNMVLALGANIIANDKPLYCNCDGHSLWPAWEDYLSWFYSDHQQHLTDYTHCTRVIMPLIPFHSTSIDPASSGYSAPLKKSSTVGATHWLGTDALGRDVLAGLIHGARFVWILGLLSTIIAAIPGIGLGMLIGYWQNKRLKWSVGQILILLIWWSLALYEAMVLSWHFDGVSFGLMLLSLLIVWSLTSKIFFRSFQIIGPKIFVPVDHVVMRGIDVFESFPKMFLLMGLIVVMTRPSVFMLSVMVAIIRWTLFVQVARAETLKERVANYVISAENINLPWWKILIKHIWPNIKSSLLVTAIFSFSAAILVEASLSFIGLGLRIEVVTWGSLLNAGRQYMPGWWLSLFPGLAIFSLLLSLNWLFIDRSKLAGQYEKS